VVEVYTELFKVIDIIITLMITGPLLAESVEDIISDTDWSNSAAMPKSKK
jgi:hypothetical protein